MAYTNKGLVEYAKECLALGDNSVYVYGTYGDVLTKSLANSKREQYPKQNSTTRTKKYKNLCDGKHYAFDCVGLIKSYYWGGYGDPDYNGKTDKSANGMYSAAKVKGNIKDIPERIGILVQMDGHIGVYIGNGYVIECTPTTKYAKQKHGLGGVCKTKLSDRKWLHWLECPYITYEKTETTKPETKPEAKPETTEKPSFFPKKGYWTYGDTHENVGKIAEFMYKTFPAYTNKKALGNYYGKNIQTSIKEFQKRTGLERDGSVGPKTLAKLEKYGFKY
jgi:hypothetical protein